MSRRACATGAPRPREGPPGHRCHCAELTSPHFRDCGHPTVCRRGGRIRMRPLRRQTASAIPSGAPASPDARQPRGQRHRHRRLLQQLQQHKVAGRRPPAELPSHPAPSPPCLRASVEGAQNLTKTGTGHAPLGSRASTATTASIRARDLAANSRGFLNQPNAAGSRENRGLGLVRGRARR